MQSVIGRYQYLAYSPLESTLIMRMADQHLSSDSLPGPRLRRAILSIARQAEYDIEAMIWRDARLGVHALRVRMKKLHALLPLVATKIAPATMDAIWHRVRFLKQAVAVNRDQHVVTELLIELQLEKFANRDALADIRNDAEGEALPAEHTLHEMKAIACELFQQLRRLRLHSLTWDDVTDACAQRYAVARRRCECCKKKSSSKRMHRWRSPVKDLYFQWLILLPDRRRCKLTRKLASLLGRLHDFNLLREHLAQAMPGKLHHIITRRMKEIRSRAFKIAHRLFAKAPKQIKRLLLIAHQR